MNENTFTPLDHKIDFVVIVVVEDANPNGDPLNGNRPRTDYDGYGEISDVCVKRKLRNAMQDRGESIFVQMESRATDGFDSLSKRAADAIGKIKDREELMRIACEKWLDVRTFGQVFAFSDMEGVSAGVRGPVTIRLARSVDPVEINSMQISKSVNGNSCKSGLSHDRLGMKHAVKFGVYVIKGSISSYLAEKTGFSQHDAEVVKDCLSTLFLNDESSARPSGSIEVVKLFWFEHNSKNGQYPTYKVHNSVHVDLKDGVISPKSLDDYVITRDELPNLKCEIIDGM